MHVAVAATPPGTADGHESELDAEVRNVTQGAGDSSSGDLPMTDRDTVNSSADTARSTLQR